MELTVNLGPDTYPIYIENGILPQTGSYIRKFFTGKKIMIISDDHVFPLYGKTVLDCFFVFLIFFVRVYDWL